MTRARRTLLGHAAGERINLKIRIRRRALTFADVLSAVRFFLGLVAGVAALLMLMAMPLPRSRLPRDGYPQAEIVLDNLVTRPRHGPVLRSLGDTLALRF